SGSDILKWIEKRSGSELVPAHDVLGLGPLLAFVDIKLDFLPFHESFPSLAADRGVMDKNFAPFAPLDESKSFGVVEPLHFARCHEAVSPYKRWRTESALV